MLPSYIIQTLTVPFELWLDCIYQGTAHPLKSRLEPLLTSRDIEGAVQLGNLYSTQFAMAFVAHLLVVRCPGPRFWSEVISKLAAMDIPLAWAGHPTILSLDGIFTNRFWESKYAAELIKAVVEVKFPSKRLPTMRTHNDLRIESRFGEDLKAYPRQGTRSKRKTLMTI